MSKHLAVTTTEPQRRTMRATVALIALLSFGGVATVSAFTDTATTDITVQAGTINLLTNTGGTDSKSTSISTGISRWAPGNSVSRAVTLKNTGTLPVDVTLVTSNTAGGLGERLTGQLSVNSAILYSGTLSTAAFSSPVRVPANGSVVVSVTMTWVSGPDDDSWASKTDNVIFTFNARNV